MTKKVVSAISIKAGNYIIIDGVACKAVDVQISKSGKHGHAKSRIVAIGLLDDKKRDFVIPSQDNVEVPIIEKKSAQVLSVNGDMANVMEMETYETFDLKIPEDMKDQVQAGVQIIYWDVLDEKVMKQLKSGE